MPARSAPPEWPSHSWKPTMAAPPLGAPHRPGADGASTLRRRGLRRLYGACRRPAVRSCITPGAWCGTRGHDDRGLAHEGTLHPLQAAFVEQRLPVRYCTSGRSSRPPPPPRDPAPSRETIAARSNSTSAAAARTPHPRCRRTVASAKGPLPPPRRTAPAGQSRHRRRRRRPGVKVVKLDDLVRSSTPIPRPPPRRSRSETRWKTEPLDLDRRTSRSR